MVHQLGVTRTVNYSMGIKTNMAIGAVAGVATVAAAPTVIGMATGVTATGPVAGGAFAGAQAAGYTLSGVQSVAMGGFATTTKAAAGAAGAAWAAYRNKK